MSPLKVSALVILAGSVVFLIAAFSPISRVFGLPTAAARMELIAGSPRAWSFSQVLFSIGSIVMAIGVGLAAIALRGRSSASLVYLGSALLILGSAAWTWHVYLRASDPRGFVQGSLPAWHFILYSLLTLAGLATIGIALVRMGLPAWSGWLMVGGSLVLLALYAVFKDMPPLVYYLLGLVLGVVLFRAG